MLDDVRRARLPPQERIQLAAEGLIIRQPLLCDECGAVMEPGEPVMCNDGYERVYGEYVLSEVDELHEDNWPATHAGCWK
jgi:hypothetical protein